MIAESSSAVAAHTDHDDGYGVFLRLTRDRFEAATGPLFTTSATDLWQTFLDGLPPERRQHYNCRACQRFVEKFGGLASLNEDGSHASAVWSSTAAPTFFRDAVRRLEQAVTKAKITGVFLCEETSWGMVSNRSKVAPGIWYHLAVTPSKAMVFKPSLVLTTEQAMAEKREDHAILCRALDEYPIDIVRHAHTLLTTGQLYRSEKCIGVASWLLDLHTRLKAANPGRDRANLVWAAVAKAPAGFCHVRSTMISTLLDDIVAGLPFEDVKRRFDDKMNPTKYQRPAAAPTDGNLAQAEKIVEKMGAAGSLKRRFARLEEVTPHALWTPAPVNPAKSPAGGVFGHLMSKAVTTATVATGAPPTVMTWAKFSKTVLPTAESIEFFVPERGGVQMSPLVTAEDFDAPPILQWDTTENRNPFSWYVYRQDPEPSRFNLKASTWMPVTAVVLQPSMWAGEEKHTHQGGAVFFLIEGARDMSPSGGTGLFVETLKSEYHGVRASIEALMRNAVVEGRDVASASGLRLQKGSEWSSLFRVTVKGGVRITYKLDRWD